MIEMVLEEFRDLKRNKVDAEELSRSKEHLKGSLMLSLESTSSRMSNLARQEKYFGRVFSLDETLENIDAVTADDVAAPGQRMVSARANRRRRARRPPELQAFS